MPEVTTELRCSELRERDLGELPDCCEACHAGPPDGFEILTEIALPVGPGAIRIPFLAGAVFRVCCTISEQLVAKGRAVLA